jgi:hypothetical protein
VNPLKLVYRWTLCNVIFGVALMVLIALYIAIGSGMPSVREYFEMNELEFFDAWPLKALMFLLCVNLAVVTWTRIPLTPPRYGVWCIHAGIITLIVGTSLYYHLKVEGRTMIPLGRTAAYFYDTAERAIFARVANQPVYGMAALPTLPRFGNYDTDNSPRRLARADLTDIQNLRPIGSDEKGSQNISDWLGLSQPVRLDIVGYYSYADVNQDVLDDPSSGDVGIELKVASPHGGDSSSIMLSSADPAAARQILGTTEVEHRQVSEGSVSLIRDAAGKIFHLSLDLPNQAEQSFDAELGKTISIAGGKYSITPDTFDPSFPMFGTHEIVQALTLHIVSNQSGKTREFWRMILAGRPLQTDFKMDPATTPPMMKGNRQKEPLDKDLVLGFTYFDSADLMPSQGGTDKQTIITAGANQMLDIHSSFSGPLEVRDLSPGDSIPLSVEGTEVSAAVYRHHVRIETEIVPTPSARRQKDEAEAGSKQVALVRVTCGNWTHDVAVPCDLYAAPDPMTGEPFEGCQWNMGTVHIPGASAVLQLQLGFLCRPMPALMTLKNFELVHYPGGQGENGPFLDFRSTLVMVDADGNQTVDVASNNSPVYFDGGRWIFFQAGYDPQGQFSTIGVGNRPGVTIMLTGCIMIVCGIIYAFYVKPVVVRRMKAAALVRAAQIAQSRQTVKV